jgi:hypothetical protein
VRRQTTWPLTIKEWPGTSGDRNHALPPPPPSQWRSGQGDQALPLRALQFATCVLPPTSPWLLEQLPISPPTANQALLQAVLCSYSYLLRPSLCYITPNLNNPDRKLLVWLSRADMCRGQWLKPGCQGTPRIMKCPCNGVGWPCTSCQSHMEWGRDSLVQTNRVLEGKGRL